MDGRQSDITHSTKETGSCRRREGGYIITLFLRTHLPYSGTEDKWKRN